MRGTQILRSGIILTFNAELANNFTSDSKGQTAAFFDGETTITTLGFRASLGEHFEWGIDAPYVWHSGGNLDATVEDFHDAFGFNDASRPNARRNRIDYFVRHQGVTYVNFQSSQSHVGDIRFWAGRNLYASQGRALTGRGLIKIPTGRVDDLSGSEAVDVSLWLEYSDESLLDDYGLTFTAGAGMGYLGKGELVPDAQNSSVFFFHVGLSYKFNKTFSLITQLDGHTKLIDTPITELSDGSLQATLGARVTVTPKLWIDAGLIEDLRHQSAPDVVFQLLIGAKL